MNLLVISGGLKQGENHGFPLGLLYLAANDPDTIILDLAVKNLNIASFIKQSKPKVVGVTMYTPNRNEALRILKIAKNNGAITVAGGPHVSIVKKQLLEHFGHFVDHFVLGDGELAWKKICAGDELDQVVKIRVDDLDSLPLPAFERINWRNYNLGGKDLSPSYIKEFNRHDLSKEIPIPITLGRGCNAKCTFCSTWWVNGKYHHHGKDWMHSMLAKLWGLGVRRLTFEDDCLTVDRQAALDLCDSLSNYDFAWFGTSRVDCIDVELAKRMHEVGCYGLSFGVETCSEKVLTNMNKCANMEQAFAAREACKKAGIFFTALMMMGFPGMNAESYAQDNEFLKKLKADDIGCLGQTWVLPGTVLYNKCKKRGLIDDDFWLGPDPYYVCPPNLEW